MKSKPAGALAAARLATGEEDSLSSAAPHFLSKAAPQLDWKMQSSHRQKNQTGSIARTVELFGNHGNGDLDIRYSAHPDIRARHSEGEVVLSLKIRFGGI